MRNLKWVQNLNSGMKRGFRKCVKKYIYLLFPLVFSILAILIHYSRGAFFMGYVDPEYFHLFNGLNLAIFNLAVDYIHHPGTSIQVIYASAAHIVNLTEPDYQLINNALNNPEKYIHAANILLVLVTAFVLMILGKKAFAYTGNVYLSLLLQLMPFGSYYLIIISGRLIPESALIAPILLLCLLIIKLLNDDNMAVNIRKYVFGFAIIGGLGMAGKFLYFPFLIIPLIIIPGKKWKVQYVFYSIVAIIIFAFPVFVNFNKSWDWYTSMFLHTGKWGEGEASIVDFASSKLNLQRIYRIDKSFILIVCLAAIQLIVFYILSFFKKTENLKRYLSVFLAILLSIFLSIFIIAKHFAIHYYIPTLLFKVFLIYLMADIFLKTFKFKHSKLLISVLALLIGFGFMFHEKESLAISMQNTRNNSEKFELRRMILSGYNTIENPLIITNHYRGSSFIESSMVAGVLMSGSLKTTFTDELMDKYPNTYFYFDWSDNFYFWDQFKQAKDFVSVNKPVYIFIGEDQEASLDIILERLNKAMPDFDSHVKTLHHFTKPDEYFYEVTFQKKDSTYLPTAN